MLSWDYRDWEWLALKVQYLQKEVFKEQIKKARELLKVHLDKKWITENYYDFWYYLKQSWVIVFDLTTRSLENPEDFPYKIMVDLPSNKVFEIND